MSDDKPQEPEWLTKRRNRAAGLAERLELPTTRTPGWEFTDLEGFDPDAFEPAVGGDAGVLEQANRLVPSIERAKRIDQVGATALSTSDGRAGAAATPSEPLLVPLAVAAQTYPGLIRQHLGAIVSTEDMFVANNEAGWQGGAFIYVPSGTRLPTPVQITAVQDSDRSALYWRTLIVLGEGAEAEVWEQYLSSGNEIEGSFNTVVELSIGEGAKLRYVCGQGLSERSWIFGTQRAEVARDGSLDWVALGFGSAQGKVRMETKLAGQGSSARVTGAYAGHAGQHLDFDTTQEHAAPHTTSDLAFRGILEDEATAVWRGMIRVDPGAQQTDAFQESRNLLLSKRAHADAIPGLEIEADDVRCTHAAAVAQVDRGQIFYLMSRGLSRKDATRLIIDGFMQTLVERLAEGPIHSAVSTALESRLAAILDR